MTLAMDDVVIAGGGPAGALAACLLARRGLRVTVVDRARFPRPKLCGDTVNPGALDLLTRHFDLTPLRSRSLPIRGMLVSGPGGTRVRGEYGDGLCGLGVTRDVLDEWLLAQAVHAGARLIDATRVAAPALDRAGRVRGVLARAGGGTMTLASPLTLGADGHRSTLGRSLGLVRTVRRPRRWAVGAYFDGVGELGPVGEMHVRAGYYIGVAPGADGRANACLVRTPAPGEPWSHPADLLRTTIAADPDLAPRFQHARMVTRPIVLGPLAVETPVPGSPGLLLLGDAAGFVDPMTGDGIHLALQSAEIAAAIAADVLAGRLDPSVAHVPYARALRQRLSVKRRVNRALRSLVGAPGAVRTAALGARLWPGAFRSIIRYAGDVPRGRRT